ncbi:hypothetical protein JCM30566_04100 [Marinitoga arctica]
MKEFLYAPGKILINEGDKVKELLILKEGNVETFSSFCQYSSLEKNGIFGSEILIPETTSFETIKVIENSRIISIEKELVEKFLLSNSNLIVHLIKKYILKLISLNNKIYFNSNNKEISEKKENLKDQLLNKAELSKKYMKINRRKLFYHITDDQIQLYFKGRHLFNKGKIKEALNIFKKIHYFNFDIYFQAEIEIWKYLSMILISPDKKYYLEKTLKEKYPFINELFSFMIFESIITNKPLPKPIVTYLKSGYLIPSNTVLFYEGEEGDWAFLILKGNVRVSLFDNSGEKLLAILSNEEIVGEIASLKEVQRTATVFTSTLLQIIIIEKDNLENLINNDPAFGLKIVKKLIKRLNFEKFWHSPLSFEEKLKFMIKKYGKNILNDSKLKINEIKYLFRLPNKKDNELIDYLYKNNIATMRADGTLKFM